MGFRTGYRICAKCASHDFVVRHHVGINSLYYVKAGLVAQNIYDGFSRGVLGLCWFCHEDITSLSWKLRKWFWNRRKRDIFDSRNTLGEYRELAYMEERLFTLFMGTSRQTMKRRDIIARFIEEERQRSVIEVNVREQLKGLTKDSVIVLTGMEMI
jgi:hypothetical protein